MRASFTCGVCVFACLIGTDLFLAAPRAEAQRAAAAPAALDTSYIPKQAIAGVVVHPRQILTSPHFEMIPIEVITAALQEAAAIDPRQVEQVIVVAIATSLQSEPSAAAIIRFAAPYDQAAVLMRVAPGVEPRTLDGRAAYVTDGVGLLMPDDRTLIVAQERDLRSVIAAGKQKVESPLTTRLSAIDTTRPLSVVAAFESIKEELVAMAAQVPQLPPPLHELAGLPEHLAAVQLDLSVEPEMQLRLELEGYNQASAAAMNRMLDNAIQFAERLIDAQKAALEQRGATATEVAGMQYAKRVLRLVVSKIDRSTQDNSLVLKVDGDIGVAYASTGVMAGLLLPAVQAAREAARRSQSANNLKQIGLAFHTFHDAEKMFPASTYDKDGKPLLSWRVHILPYLEAKSLYDQFHLDEPWNSPHNIKLVEQMPALYANPNQTAESKPGTTVYLTTTGKAGLYKDKKSLAFRDILDGSSSTIMVVEAEPGKAVIWSKPDDLAIDPDNPLDGLADARPGGFQALLCDGSVRFISQAISPEVLLRLFDPRDGQPVGQF